MFHTNFNAMLAKSTSVLAQTDYQNGLSRLGYVVIGLLLLTPIISLLLYSYVASQRAARAKLITDALKPLHQISLFDLASRLNRPDLDQLWRELWDLQRSGQLMGFNIDEERKVLERPIPPDPWTCAACGASNDGRDAPLLCASCDSPRANCS